MQGGQELATTGIIFAIVQFEVQQIQRARVDSWRMGHHLILMEIITEMMVMIQVDRRLLLLLLYIMIVVEQHHLIFQPGSYRDGSERDPAHPLTMCYTFPS